MFFNLKRYEFDQEKKKLKKVFSNLKYPEEINLGFLLDTPTGEDNSYILYAVTIHKGQSPVRGHYYSLINTSLDPDNPKWFKFNDGDVRKVTRDFVLKFSGQKKKEFYLSKDHGKFIER
jgi:ubiquitin C-terminal hydrolase